MNLNEFAKDCLEISKRRTDLEESSVLDYLKHCSGEVLEAYDAYAGQMIGVYNKGDVASELADIIICVLLVCAKEGIDVEQALKDAMEKNKERI